MFKLSLELEVLLGGYFVDTSSALVRFFLSSLCIELNLERNTVTLSVANSGAEQGTVSTRTRR